jgi:hypothetical protein
MYVLLIPGIRVCSVNSLTAACSYISRRGLGGGGVTIRANPASGSLFPLCLGFTTSKFCKNIISSSLRCRMETVFLCSGHYGF